MLDFLGIIHTSYASGLGYDAAIVGFSFKAMVSIFALVLLFVVLLTEKIDKAIVSILIAGALVMLQVFSPENGSLTSSQQVAAGYIYKNLDIFAFIIGMMILSGLAKGSGVFSYIAFSLVKKLNGSPKKIFFAFAYMAFFMTIFISNIPTIIILAPIVILVTRKLGLNTIAYVVAIIIFANLGGAVTPISDPTTYYQANTLGFSFWQVFSNTGFIMFLTTISSSIYLYIIFRKKLSVQPNLNKLNEIEPVKYIKSKKNVFISLLMLLLVIVFIISKDFIYKNTGIKLDNGTIALFGAFLSVLLLKQNIRKVLKSKVDYVTLFFFAGLFIIVGALEYNGVIEALANGLVQVTYGDPTLLLFIITAGSAFLSVFIDNIPYNIAMVSTLQHFLQDGVLVGGAWTALAWGLNSCTSIGGAGSPIGSACNVIALEQAEKHGVVMNFIKYLYIGIPLVIINSFISFWVLYFRYLG